MTDWRHLGWVLAVLGIAATVVGAYRTGTSGEVNVLFIVGLGATTVWLALHEQLQGATDADSGAGESA